jgi:GT2 family glycosyltransferase
MKSKPKISIIIPVRQINKYITDEIIPALKQQTYQNFELIIIPNKKQDHNFPDWVKIIPSHPHTRPVPKRELGIKHSTGEVLAFLDDDAFPAKDWLEQAVKLLQPEEIAAVCGPGVTPPNDNWRQKVSGWVWKTKLGAGGAGVYRCQPMAPREVDDFPTFNLLVKKNDYHQAGGFEKDFWPGEDTKLCHDLVYVLNKKILYHPKIKVFHHRREIFKKHLQQISRYGQQRGNFVHKLPKNNAKIKYFIPLFFLIGLIIGPGLINISKPLFYIYLFFIGIYLFWSFLTIVKVLIKSKDLKIALALGPSIWLTHIVYGIFFLRGMIKE